MNSEAQQADEPLVEPLTRREREILGLLDQGFSAPEIAEQLTLAVASVKWHIQHIYGKLGVSGKRQALTRAQALGLLEDYYRQISGEHPDWDDYRAAMVADNRLVVRLHVDRIYGQPPVA